MKCRQLILTLCLNLLIITTSIASSSDASNKENVTCDRNSEDFLVMELFQQMVKLSDYNSSKAAKTLILNLCKKEQETGNKDVYIRGEKIIFSQFSDQYDVNDPTYFCKNNAGYSAYLASITSKLRTLSLDKTRKERALFLKDNPLRPLKPLPQSKPKQEDRWNCEYPNYVKSYRMNYNRARMEEHLLAHPGFKCIKVILK